MIEKVILNVNGELIKVKGQMFRYDPRFGYEKQSNLVRYQHEESSKMQVTHIQTNAFTKLPIYWLKSYGLVSWSFDVRR